MFSNYLKAMIAKEIKIRRGLDIPLKGKAEKADPKPYSSSLYAVQPTDFRMMKPRLMVKEGDAVQCGTPIVQNKLDERMILVSPISGTVKSIVRGEKRKLLRIEIESDNNQSAIDFGSINPASSSREKITEAMLKAGMWPFIRQRPYGVIAKPEDKVRDIFITAFDSAPLAPDADLIVDGKEKEIQTAIQALQLFTEGKIHLSLHKEKNKSEIYSRLQGIELHTFSGPHPAGNIGVQIHHIAPINKGEVIWTLKLQDLITIGTFLLTGKVDFTRRIVLAGSELNEGGYFEAIAGVQLSDLLKDNLKQDNVRVISGDVLTGTDAGKDGYLGFYHNMVSVIKEGDYYEFFGWAAPGFKKHSMSKTFFSWMMPKKKYALDTNFHGGVRPFVMTGQYEKVFPFDIYPVQLLKSAIVEDIDLMEQLGIYEVAEEDFALCEYVCTSKIESQSIIRDGIDLMIKELS